ncbi:MAG: hypothetical protein MJZ66_08890 [Bacteroidales bacterium]|nr:hypothetical protein [Bacteroidales bacterium]
MANTSYNLTLDSSNKQAIALIDFLKSLTFVTITENPMPNDETIQAMKDAENGNTYKAKDVNDLFEWLNN